MSSPASKSQYLSKCDTESVHTSTNTFQSRPRLRPRLKMFDAPTLDLRVSIGEHLLYTFPVLKRHEGREQAGRYAEFI